MIVIIDMENIVKLKYLSEDATVVREKDMPKLKTRNPKKYSVFHDELGEIGSANIVTVEVESMNYSVFYADVTTGSLYDINTLRCLTGQLELK